VRILWVKANKLLPVHSGGDIRSYHIARYLASQHSLVFLSYYSGPRDADYERQLAEHFPGSVCICTGGRESRIGRALDYVSRLASGVPYAVGRFQSREVKDLLQSWFEPRRFDVAICDFLDAAVNFPAVLSVPSILFQHNVESEIWRRHAQTETSAALRLVYGMEHRRMLAYEQQAVQRFHHVIAVSEHDRSLMSAWVAPSRLTVVPTGVDLQEYRPCEPDPVERESAPLVIFVGAMDWEPNVDASEYFCQQVWPKVLAKVPEARFRIVGRNPDPRVQRLASNSVEVTGRVPAVIDHLREATVVAVPLRIGGGTRLKIYEAMAAGKAVVSTSVGAEGLDVHDGYDIILADSPKAFADSIVTLLSDRELRRRYESSAAEAAAGCGWPGVGKKFEALLVSEHEMATRPPQHRTGSVPAPDGPRAIDAAFKNGVGPSREF